MASKITASTALLLALNLLFFSLVCSTKVCPPTPNKPKPKPKPHPTPKPALPSCPRDTLKFGVCANVLGLINLNLGSPPQDPCCSLLEGIADLEAAVCLCTAIKAGVLGLNLDISVDLTVLLNYCGKKFPAGYKCA